MHILITGATGFLGRFLAPFLRQQGHTTVELSSTTCDLCDPRALDPWSSQKFDQIYHLAVWMQAGDFCLKTPAEQWLINQKINIHMLDWWRRHQPQALMIAMGTSCSYDPAHPLEENYYLQGLPIDSLFSYGMTKRMLLAGLLAMHKQWNLNYLYLIPSTLYGGGYLTDGRQPHFIFDLVRKILRGKSHNEPVILWGDGEQKRELIHVGDFVRTMVQLAATQHNQVINIGAGKEYSIKEFAQAICSLTGYPFEKIQFDLTRYVGARSKVLLIDKLKQLLPQYTLRPLNEGLQEMIDWYAQ